MKKASSFKMKGFGGYGNSPMKAKESPSENLLKAVPNKKAYDKLSDENKKGFDKAAKKAGLPTKKSPAKFDPMKTMRPGVKGFEEFQQAVRNPPPRPKASKAVVGKSFKKAGKKSLGKVATKVAGKVAGKFLGPVGAALTVRDAYKSYKDVKGGMKVGKALKKNFLGL